MGPMVSESRRFCRSKHLTYLEYLSIQPLYTMQLFKPRRRWNTLAMSYSNTWERWNKLHLWWLDASFAPPTKFTPTRTSAYYKTSSATLSPQKRRLKGSRAKGKSTDYSMKNWHKWQRQLCVKNLRLTLSQTWQLNQFVFTVPTRIQTSAW